jgi:hypothetical protein
MGIVRDKEGLTYSISAVVSDDSITDGRWDIAASFAPGLLDKGIASTRRELGRWWSEGVTEQELAARKQGLVGTYLVGLSTTAGLAGAILTNIQRGYDVNRLDEFPGRQCQSGQCAMTPENGAGQCRDQDAHRPGQDGAGGGRSVAAPRLSSCPSNPSCRSPVQTGAECRRRW